MTFPKGEKRTAKSKERKAKSERQRWHYLTVKSLHSFRTIIYADLKCIIEKIHGCANNPEKSSRTELGNYKPSAFSISTFKNRQNKHDEYRGKNCM